MCQNLRPVSNKVSKTLCTASAKPIGIGVHRVGMILDDRLKVVGWVRVNGRINGDRKEREEMCVLRLERNCLRERK